MCSILHLWFEWRIKNGNGTGTATRAVKTLVAEWEWMELRMGMGLEGSCGRHTCNLYYSAKMSTLWHF